jgi:hypothetical protein
VEEHPIEAELQAPERERLLESIALVGIWGRGFGVEKESIGEVAFQLLFFNTSPSSID